MAFSINDEEKKSLLFTAIAFVALLLVLIFIKLRQDIAVLQLEGGGGGGGDIAVNFGDSDVGMGDNFESKESARSTPKPVVTTPAPANEILTSESDDAPIIKDVVKPTEKPKKPETKPIEKPAPPKQPQPSNATKNALDDLLKGSDKSGDGSDKVGGNKGKAYGSTNDRGYSGGGGSGGGTGGGDGTGDGTGQGAGSGSGSGGGSGSGRGTGVGNYNLAGRKVISKPQPRYECNEQGKVVVQITVNAAGKVVSAAPGYRGTTNPASCLAQQAKAAAMNTTFDANPNGTGNQTGTIIYNFRLTD